MYSEHLRMKTLQIPLCVPAAKCHRLRLIYRELQFLYGTL
jgi:hypothetical protein